MPQPDTTPELPLLDAVAALNEAHYALVTAALAVERAPLGSNDYLDKWQAFNKACRAHNDALLALTRLAAQADLSQPVPA